MNQLNTNDLHSEQDAACFVCCLSPVHFVIRQHCSWISCTHFAIINMQPIAIKEEESSNHNTIALSSVFVGMNPPHWQTTATPLFFFSFFFFPSPLVQHFPELMDNVEAVWRWNFTNWQLLTFSPDTVFNVNHNNADGQTDADCSVSNAQACSSHGVPNNTHFKRVEKKKKGTATNVLIWLYGLVLGRHGPTDIWWRLFHQLLNILISCGYSLCSILDDDCICSYFTISFSNQTVP